MRLLYYLVFGLFFCSFWACDAPLSLSIAEAKQRAQKEFRLKDTLGVGIKQVMQDSEHHWLVAYNKVHRLPAIYLFRAENAREHSHHISLKHKQKAKITDLHFEDVTYDGNLELLVYLHYDFDLSYQGKELVIFRYPFDTLRQEEIFSFPLQQQWEHVDSFDQKYGLPLHERRIDYLVTPEFFEGNILLRGTIEGRHNHLLEFSWDKGIEEFKKVLDEDVHEEEEEAHKGGVVGKLKGAKRLFEVVAHEDDCKAYIIEDVGGHVIKLPKNIHDALLCSPITSLSNDGHYLLYMDHPHNQFRLYDFNADKQQIMIPQLSTLEGLSTVIWRKKNGRLSCLFVAVNFEEYSQKTALYFCEEQKEGPWSIQVFDLPIHYECNPSGECAPLKDYHFKLGPRKNFLYRRSKNDDWQLFPLGSN